MSKCKRRWRRAGDLGDRHLAGDGYGASHGDETGHGHHDSELRIPTTTVALAACKMLQQQCVHGRYLRLPRRLRPVRRSLYRSRVGYERWNAWEQLRFAMASLRLGYEALVPPVWHRVQLGK